MSYPNSNRHFQPPMVGGSSLLVIFAVLCLTIFTLLTLSTVQANSRLSEASIRAVTDYYAADQQAEEIFSQLRAGEIPDHVQQTPASDLDPADSTHTTGWIYSYTCPISDTQELHIQILWDQDTWTILRWQAVSTVTYS